LGGGGRTDDFEIIYFLQTLGNEGRVVTLVDFADDFVGQSQLTLMIEAPCEKRLLAHQTKFDYPMGMSDRDLIPEPDWLDWYLLTPQERWQKSMELWESFLTLGGSVDPEPDTQSPFFDPEEFRAGSFDGRPGVRVIRRSGV
jgi:hypothetical protein